MTYQTRNQVAQLALNTLKTPVVRPEDNTLHITTTVGGAETSVVSGKVNYKITASSDDYARAISAVEGSDTNTIDGIAGYVIELGEKLYDGKLQLREKGVYDAFGRPARKWQYDGQVFGTYAKKEQLRKEYTVKVTGKDLYDLLGADLIKQYAVNVTIDGETDRAILDQSGGPEHGSNSTSYYFTDASMIRTNTYAVGGTGNGVLTQVYVDSINHIVDIAIINTYLAKATQDYNSKDNDVDLEVYKIDNHGSQQNPRYVKCNLNASNNPNTEKLTVKGEDFAITDVKDGDFFLVNVAEGEIKVLKTPEIVSEVTLNSFKKGDWVKNDDVQYDYASTAQYDYEVLDNYDQSNMRSVTYDVILDQYGYLVGLELNEEVNQYLFLTGMDLGYSNLSAKNASANVIFLDGTMATVTVNVDKSEKAGTPDGKTYTITGGGSDFNIVSGDNWSQVNTWCTYTVDANGIYTLKQVGTRSDARSTDGIKGAKKIAQSVMGIGHASFDTSIVSTTTVTLDAGKLEISGKQVRLNGSRLGAYTQGDFAYVYGNEDTVYINTSLKAVTPKSGTGARAIVDKVDSVTTGVKNVNMTVKDLDNTTGDLSGAILPGGSAGNDKISNEIYALYKDNGYIIAVVTLGAEDDGTSSNWAYIVGDVKQEDYLGNNQWRWTKQAIINGKLVDLTEIDDSSDVLDDAKTLKGNWYSLRFDKDGNVVGVKEENSDSPANKDAIKFNETNDKFIESVKNVYPATIGAAGFDGETFTGKSDSLLLKADYRCYDDGADPDDKHPSGTLTGTIAGKREMMFKAGTLYTDRTEDGEGFQIDPSANIVVLLSENHSDNPSKIFNTKTGGFVGWPGMEDAIKELKSETSDGWSDFDGILYAVFNKGVATSVILDCRSGKGNQKPKEDVKPMELTITKVDKATGNTIGTETIDWYGTALSGLADPTGYHYDSDSGVTFRENGRGSVTIRYEKNAAPAEPMTVMVKFVADADNAVLATEVKSNVTDKANDKTLIVSAIADATNVDWYVKDKIPAGFKLKDGEVDYVDLFKSGETASITFKVVPVTREVKIASGYQITWEAARGYAANDTTASAGGATVNVPVNAAATITVPAAAAKYYVKFDDTDAGYKKGGEPYTLAAGNTNKDFSGIETDKYHKVTGASTTGSSAGMPAGITGLTLTIADGSTWVKEGEQATVNIAIAGTATANATDNVTLQLTAPAANVTSDTFATANNIIATGTQVLVAASDKVAIANGADADVAFVYTLG